MKKYKLWIKKYNLLKNENEIIEEVIATNDIYHEIGYIYCTSLEKIERIDYQEVKEQEEKMEYRYMIWNDVKKEFQFPRICETTEKGANTCLFNFIGNDARKDRFQIKKVEKEEAKKIIKELKQKYKAERIKSIIPNVNFSIILELVKKNDSGGIIVKG